MTHRPSHEALPETPHEREPREVPIHDRLLWGLGDIAGLLGLNRRTLERLRSSGRFPAPDIKVGKRPLWRPATVHRWVEGGGA